MPARHHLALPHLLLCLLALAGGTALGAPLPEPAQREPHAWRAVGSGELRFLGRRIYDAGLWSTSGRFEGLDADQPMALTLWYGREFSRDQLLSITHTAWRLLGETTPSQQQRWLADLRGLWSDVGPGQNLTAVVEPGGETRFYDRERLLGRIADPRFGPAFLAIWLHPRSVVGDLRTDLLGGPTADARRASAP